MQDPVKIHALLSIYIQPDQPELAVTPPKSEPAINYPIYIAKHNFDPTVDDDLPVKRGDLVYIISTRDGNRWWARLKDSGIVGYIPSTSVMKYEPLEEHR